MTSYEATPESTCIVRNNRSLYLLQLCEATLQGEDDWFVEIIFIIDYIWEKMKRLFL